MSRRSSLATRAHRLRATGFAIAIAMVVAACSGGTTSAPSGTWGSTVAPSRTATVAPASATPRPSLGPATASFTLTGDGRLAGAVTKLTIRCGTPSHDGLTIDMFGQTTDANVATRITLSTAHVAVHISSGSGSTYTARDFEGSGLSGFDPATGATVDSPLAAVKVPGAVAGSLGALTKISGTVACGDQTAGQSTLVFAGDSPLGPIVGGLDPVNVECIPYSGGDRRSIIGMTKAGSTPVLMVITLLKDDLSVAAWPKGGSTRFYSGQSDGSVTLTPNGAHVEANAVEPYNPTAPLSIHVSGDVTCGWTSSP